MGAMIMFSLLLIGWGFNIAKAQEILSIEKFTIVGVMGFMFLAALVFPFTIILGIIFILFMTCCGNIVKKPKYLKKRSKHRR